MLSLSSSLDRVTEWRESKVGYGNYTTPWHWNPDGKRWHLRTSEGAGHKPYWPSEYVVARIEGRAPRWSGGRTAAVTFDDLERKLSALGWLRRPAEHFGAEPGKCVDGVVLYKESGVVFHAAILDHARGDWGGKLAALMPIGRFKRPEDFLTRGILSRVTMEFFGPRVDAVVPAPGMQKSDEWMHENATAVTCDR